VVIYYLLPLNHSSTWAAVTILVIGLVLFIALTAFQVRSIGRSRFPALRAIEALATSIPLFLLLFASVYVVMATISASNFSEPLTHTDITAKSEAARLVVTSQMIADLLIIGLGLRVIVGAVTRSRQQRPEDAGTG
jgi:predicted Kef-type K+ transport protein